MHQGITSEQWKQKVNRIIVKQQIKSIHIFEQKFTTQKHILSLMRLFPNLKYISFNCHSKLHEEQTLSIDFLKQLQKVSIEFKWKISRYIQKYYKYIYFNQKNIYKTQTVVYKKNDNLQKLLLNNKEPITFWVYEESILQRALQKCNLRYLTALNIIGSNFRINKFQNLQSIKQLKTLVLKGVQFDQKLQQNNHLVEFIRENKFISIFILQQTNISQNTLNEVLGALQSLPILKRLSLNFFQQTDANFLHIVKNNQLQLLHLKNLKFCFAKEEQIIYLSSKLKFLCLCQCRSLELNLLARLLKESSKTITHLYLSCCSSLQTDWFTMIQPLANQVCFGLDQINISAMQLVNCFKKMKANSGLKIEYLAIDKDQTASYLTLNNQIMDQLNQILPDLKFLSIFHQKDLKRYDFSKFKALRVILTDQRLKSKLVKKMCDNIRIITDKRNQSYRSQ